MLLTSLQTSKRAGLESATLDADADNSTEATRLYAQAGSREAWRWVAYGRHIHRRT